jgi:hypothetical protein
LKKGDSKELSTKEVVGCVGTLRVLKVFQSTVSDASSQPTVRKIFLGTVHHVHGNPFSSWVSSGEDCGESGGEVVDRRKKESAPYKYMNNSPQKKVLGFKCSVQLQGVLIMNSNEI